MNHAEVEVFLAKHPRISIHAAELIGFELLSTDVTPTDMVGRLALVRMILDCNGSFGRRIPYHLAESTTGTLTLWVLPPEPLLQ
jgi:hypothetical protein